MGGSHLRYRKWKSSDGHWALTSYYDTTAQKWKQLPNKFFSAELAIAFSDNKLYAMSYHRKQKKGSFMIFDFATQRWNELPNLITGVSHVSQPSAVVVGRKIYLYTGHFFAYDLDTSQWVTLSNHLSSDYFHQLVSFEGVPYLIGYTMNSVPEYYDITHDRWHVIPNDHFLRQPNRIVGICM